MISFSIVDKIFSIFEIEKKYYNPNLYRYIGHPLINKTHFSNSYDNSLKNIGFFLGSRRQEIYKNIHIISKLLNSLKDQKDLIFNFFIRFNELYQPMIYFILYFETTYSSSFPQANKIQS